MCTHIEQGDFLSYTLKTKRQKKRLVKKERDKQLIAMHREERAIDQQIRALPMIPLEQPYQKGWKRFFVLREDVARSRMAGFYQSLLQKINTVSYSNNRDFKKKKLKHGKRIRVAREQKLREITEWEWLHNKLKLDEKEKMHFHPVVQVHKKGIFIVYVFNDPWRYRLRIAPHMITHVKKLDKKLMAERQSLDNTIVRKHLRNDINRLVYGKSYKWRQRPPEEKKLKSIFKQPVEKIMDLINEV